MAHILIIDDKSDITGLIADILKDEGHSTREAHSVAAAQEELEAIEYDLIILDIWLEDNQMDGVGLLRIIRKQHPYTPVVMISGHATAETAALAMKLGAQDFVEKPFKSEKILFAVRRCIEMRMLNEHQDRLTPDNLKQTIIGHHPAIVSAREQCIGLAKNSSRFMIFGKDGVGKKLLARTVHDLSSRRSQRFISYRPHGRDNWTLNRDIHGNEKTLSIFEQAQHGTLYIEDIHILPARLQQDVLEIVQKSSIEPRGQKIDLNVRIITSTSINPEIVHKQNLLHPSLYTRLTINTVTLPDLRERIGDLIELVQHFISQYQKNNREVLPNPNQEVVSILLGYTWPGNLDELAQVVYSFCILCKYHGLKQITSRHLPREILMQHKANYQDVEDMSLYMQKNYRDAKQIFERSYLEAQIRKFAGNISKTSNFIGLDRTALHRKMKELGLVSHVEHHPDNFDK